MEVETLKFIREAEHRRRWLNDEFAKCVRTISANSDRSCSRGKAAFPKSSSKSFRRNAILSEISNFSLPRQCRDAAAADAVDHNGQALPVRTDGNLWLRNRWQANKRKSNSKKDNDSDEEDSAEQSAHGTSKRSVESLIGRKT